MKINQIFTNFLEELNLWHKDKATPAEEKLILALSNRLRSIINASFKSIEKQGVGKSEMTDYILNLDKGNTEIWPEIQIIIEHIQTLIKFLIDYFELDLSKGQDLNRLINLFNTIPHSKGESTVDYLKQRLSAINSHLGNEDMTKKVVLSQPFLWTQNPDTLKTKWQYMADILGSEELTRKIIVEQPSLWGQNSETLKANWINISNHLGSDELTKKVIINQSSLWGQNQESLKVKWQNITDHVGSEESTRKIIIDQPFLWGQNPETLKAKWQNISDHLGSEELTKMIIIDQPFLWTQNLETLRSKWQNITRYLGSDDMTKKVIVEQPCVWGLNQKKVEEKIAKVKKYDNWKQLISAYPEIFWFSVRSIPGVIEKINRGDLSGVEYVRLVFPFKREKRTDFDMNRGSKELAVEDEKDLSVDDVDKFWVAVSSHLSSEQLETVKSALANDDPIPKEILAILKEVSVLKELV